MIYSICGYNIEFNPIYNLLMKRAEKYKIADDIILNGITPDIILKYDEQDVIDFLKKSKLEFKEDNLPFSEYSLAGALLFKRMLDFDGFVLHGSAIEYNGCGYIFTGVSGSGKSTHTKLWQEHFGIDKVNVINDDKPIIRLINNKFYVCGNPFSGKEDLNANIITPLCGICVIEKSYENAIQILSKKQSVNEILKHTLILSDTDKMERLFNLINKYLYNNSVYKLKCTISKDAVTTAYNAMIRNQ